MMFLYLTSYHYFIKCFSFSEDHNVPDEEMPTVSQKKRTPEHTNKRGHEVMSDYVEETLISYAKEAHTYKMKIMKDEHELKMGLLQKKHKIADAKLSRLQMHDEAQAKNTDRNVAWDNEKSYAIM